MNRLMSIMLSTIFLVMLSAGLTAEVPPADVMNAAREGLSRFMLEGVPGDIIDFADLTQAKLDLSFQVNTVKSERLQNPLKQKGLQNDREVELHSMVTPTLVWYFVVKVNEKPIALMTVAFFEGKWTTVAIGETGLSKEITAISETWGKGCDLRFIRIFEAKADFMEIRKDSDSIGYVPFESARVSLNLDSKSLKPDTLLYNSEIVKPLREIVSKVVSKDFSGNGIDKEK